MFGMWWHGRWLSSLAAALVLAVATGCLGRGVPSAPAAIPVPVATTVASPSATGAVGPVFLIVMENKEYGQVIGSPDAPYLNQLAASSGVLAEQAYAITHPSLPNYLALLAGDTFGVTSDCTTCVQDQPNLVDALEAGGRSWGAYMEDLPAPCFLGESAGGALPGLLSQGGYALKHDPFLYFQDIRANLARCRQIVPLSQLDGELASGQVPDFVWITPDLAHDTHDASVATGDQWLAAYVPRILSSPAWRPGAWLIIAWDEGTSNAGCCGMATGGHVPLVLVRGDGVHGRLSEPLTHYSVLRTIADVQGVQRPGHSADPGVPSMVDAPLN